MRLSHLNSHAVQINQPNRKAHSSASKAPEKRALVKL
jgi:hypothetical protein